MRACATVRTGVGMRSSCARSVAGPGFCAGRRVSQWAQMSLAWLALRPTCAQGLPRVPGYLFTLGRLVKLTHDGPASPLHGAGPVLLTTSPAPRLESSRRRLDTRYLGTPLGASPIPSSP